MKNGTYQSHLFWGNNRNSYWKWGLYLSSSINRYQKKSPNWQCDKVEKYTATWVIFVDTYHLFKGTIEPATPLKFNMETWSLKSPGKGDSELGKPSLSGSMLRFGGVLTRYTSWSSHSKASSICRLLRPAHAKRWPRQRRSASAGRLSWIYDWIMFMYRKWKQCIQIYNVCI